MFRAKMDFALLRTTPMLEKDAPMRTNGLVGNAGLALLLCLLSSAAAQDVPPVPEPATDYTSGAFEVAAEGCDECCLCCQVPHWFGGVEATFLKLIVDNDALITLSLDEAGTPGTDASFRTGQGISTFTTAPRIFLGRKFGDNWGVQARYFEMNEQLERRPTTTPGIVEQANFGTYREVDRAGLYALDLEVLRTFRPGLWTVDGTLGARHAELSGAADLSVYGVFTTGNFVNLQYGNFFKFDGTGVTGSLTGKRAIPWQYANLYLGARASSLWGRSDSRAYAAGTVASSPSAPLVGAATVSRNDALATMTIGEIQVGIEWDIPLQNLPFNFFFKAGLEYQHWQVDAPPTGGAGFGGTIGTLTTNSFSSAASGPPANRLNPDAQLYGLVLSMGLTW